MASASVLHQQILKQIKELPEQEKREVLSFIEYLKIREDRTFIDYVNSRTKAAIDAKERGEHFLSLEELKQEYA